jgi:ribosomal protein S18 acetylase RimI-like enzyme
MLVAGRRKKLLDRRIGVRCPKTTNSVASKKLLMLTDKPPISIRKANAIDSQGILECLQEAFDAYRSVYTPGAFRDTVVGPEDLENRMATMCVFVAASSSGEVVGTVACNVVGPQEGHIRGMAVRPAWHGVDVAAKLIRSVEAELRNRGCTWISLDTTLPLQRAMRFYEKQGFQRSGRISDFFGMQVVEFVKPLGPADS